MVRKVHEGIAQLSDLNEESGDSLIVDDNKVLIGL